VPAAGSAVAARDATQPAGAAVCLMNREMGQFEYMAAAAAAAAGSGSQVSSSAGSTASVCAPLVRSTVQGRRCVLPFTWQGAPRDDCIWRHGMSVCPVAASTAEAAAAAAGVSNRRAESAGDYYGGNQAGDDATEGLQDLLVSPTGASPWVWQQCARDYETRWEQPPVDAPGRRWVPADVQRDDGTVGGSVCSKNARGCCVWQQCARDYKTRWEQPPGNAPGRR
jgi:hypothetical protein